MQAFQCEQGTVEWHCLRAGVITASNFSMIRDRYKKPAAKKGQFKDAAKNYAFKLAVERISGSPLDQPDFETWQSRRGREMEAEARAMHALLIDRDIEQTGIVKTDDGKFGASADGLIGEDGGAEYKCFLAPEKLRSVLIEDDFEGVDDQIQGGLWITGRQWWDFVMYCPALSVVGKDVTIQRVKRDEKHIEAMRKDLLEFDALVEQYVEQLRAGEETPEPAAGGTQNIDAGDDEVITF